MIVRSNLQARADRFKKEFDKYSKKGFKTKEAVQRLASEWGYSEDTIYKYIKLAKDDNTLETR